MTTKTCSICYETKSCDDFHKRKDSKDGYRGDCKVCTKKRINKYRSVNKEKVNKWNKETYYRNIEKHKETKKKWRCDNREKHEELKKNWKIKNNILGHCQRRMYEFQWKNPTVKNKKPVVNVHRAATLAAQRLPAPLLQ